MILEILNFHQCKPMISCRNDKENVEEKQKDKTRPLPPWKRDLIERNKKVARVRWLCFVFYAMSASALGFTNTSDPDLIS